MGEARHVRVLGVCWGADKIPKRLEVLVPKVNPTGLDGWEKIKVSELGPSLRPSFLPEIILW